MARNLTIDDIVKVINISWESVDKSIVGPIIRDAEVKHADEAWKPAERMAIMNMASYETYRMVLQAQLDLMKEKE